MLNVAPKKHPYPIPFINEVINIVIGHKVYMFLNGFPFILLHFHSTWELVQNNFCYWLEDLCMGCDAFWGQKWTTYLSKGNYECLEWIYYNVFTNIFLDDFIGFNNMSTHIKKLKKYFFKCRGFGISLNSKKCAFMIYSITILGFIVSKKGKTSNRKK
jgi:hypothetical protein